MTQKATRSRRLMGLAAGVCAMFVSAVSARCEQVVTVGGARALLDKPSAPKGSLILIPGGDGVMGINLDGTFSSLGGNQLVRTRKAYVGYDLATLTVDRGVDIGAAIAFMKTVAQPVTVAATSRGSLRVPGALGAKPDALVLTSAFLAEVRTQTAAASLPRTLVVHHRLDGCRHTPPSGVEPFLAWSKGRATVAWMDGGSDTGDPCQAKGYHGFHGLDSQVVATVARFALAKP